MTTVKKGSLFRLRLKRVPTGIEVSVLTEPALFESFQVARRERRGVEAQLTTTSDGLNTILRLPREASDILEHDRQLAPFLFQENPTTLVCPVSRTKEQLVTFAQAARDFIARWYEARLQPIEVETSIAVRLSDSVEMGSAGSTS